MNTNTRIYLKSKSLSHVSWEKEDQDFVFIFGGKKFLCNRVQAQILSPEIRNLRITDPTFSSFNITSSTNFGAFEAVFKLAFGNPFVFSIEDRIHVYNIACELGNPDLIELAFPDIEYTVENVLPTIMAKYSAKLSYIKESVYIASNFPQFSEESLCKLPFEVFNQIISQDCLVIESEKELLNLVVKYIETYPDSYPLLKNIYADFLDRESMFIYISLIDTYKCYEEVWPSIFQRLILDVMPEDRGHSHNYLNPSKSHSFLKKSTLFENSGSAFNGILAHMIKEHGGNVADKGFISITTSSTWDGHMPSSLIDGNRDQFATKHASKSWICFNFKDNRINITGYALKTNSSGPGYHHLRSWTLSGSEDNTNWDDLDVQVNNQDLNGAGFSHYYPIANIKKFYQYFRIRQDDTTHSTDTSYNHLLQFRQIEFFGRFYTP